MIKSAISVASILLLGACAFPKYNYTSETKSISFPELNQVTTAFVGDEMVNQGVEVTRDVLILKSDYTVAGFNFSKGTYPKTGSDENRTYFKLGNSPGAGTSNKPLYIAGITINKHKSLCFISNHNNVEYCGRTPADYEIGKEREQTAQSFQQTLIYSGKVGNKINVSYREFQGAMARPAFNNDVEYDLSDSRQIGYKGALIEVLDADNQKIKYKVLKNFNVK